MIFLVGLVDLIGSVTVWEERFLILLIVNLMIELSIIAEIIEELGLKRVTCHIRESSSKHLSRNIVFWI